MLIVLTLRRFSAILDKSGDFFCLKEVKQDWITSQR